MLKTTKILFAMAFSAVTLSTSIISPIRTLADVENNVCRFSYTVSFADSATRKKVENINARICKREYDKDSADYYIGDEITVAEWNTSDFPTFTTDTLVNDMDRYEYRVYVDRLPDGYVSYNERQVDIGLPFSEKLEGNVYYIVQLDRGDPLVPDDFPLEGEFSLDLKVLDKETNNTVKDVQCELCRSDTGEVLAEWNTSDKEIMHLDGLRYECVTRKLNQQKGNIEYYIRVVSFPDNFEIYHFPNTNERYMCGFSILEFINGSKLERTLYLIKKDSSYEEQFSEKIVTTTSPTHQWNVTDPSTTTTIEATTVTVVESKLKGDANLDGKATIADAVAILQHIANRDRYELLPQGLINADVDGVAGVTANDARVLQAMDSESHRV